MDVLVVASVVAISATTAPFKCGGLPNTFPGYETDDPVVVVDDRVMASSDDLRGLEAKDVGDLEVSCWNPETGEFGVSPGIPLVRVITQVEYRDVEGPALAALLAQAEVHRRTGAYAASVDELKLEHASDLVLELSADSSGWNLVILSRFHRCEVSDDLSDEATRGSLPASACGWRHEEQSAALRRAYHGADGPGADLR